MKNVKLFTLLSLIMCSIITLVGCGNETSNTDDITINKEADKTHYLKFMSDGREVIRMVVLKGETYDDLFPYFPILTQSPGYIKYWDGDYNYTKYTKDNQFEVYNEDDCFLEIYSHLIKID